MDKSTRSLSAIGTICRDSSAVRAIIDEFSNEVKAVCFDFDVADIQWSQKETPNGAHPSARNQALEQFAK